MNTVKKGSAFESEVFEYLKQEIEAERFGIKANSCKIYKQQKYFSKDRESNIVFDIAIEVYLAGSTTFSFLFLIECKNYGHSVPIDDVEEFFQKTQQVAAANSKAIIFSRASFQKGAKTFSKSKGIGLVRYSSSIDNEWVLHRTMASSLTAKIMQNVSNALDYEESHFIKYKANIQTPLKPSNNIQDLFLDLLYYDDSYKLFSESISSIYPEPLNNTIINKLIHKVPYLKHEQLEKISQTVLKKIKYSDGAVDLDVICDLVREKYNLRIIHHQQDQLPIMTLGEILFEKNEIHLYFNNQTPDSKKRFTLAHELGHYFLQHRKYIQAEQLVLTNTDFDTRTLNEFNDADRLEYQANYFAACLLMPKERIITLFNKLLVHHNIRNRGFSPLFLDKQPCNLQPYLSITESIMDHFQVSRTAITNRLEELNLLVREDIKNSITPYNRGNS